MLITKTPTIFLSQRQTKNFESKKRGLKSICRLQLGQKLNKMKESNKRTTSYKMFLQTQNINKWATCCSDTHFTQSTNTQVTTLHLHDTTRLPHVLLTFSSCPFVPTQLDRQIELGDSRGWSCLFQLQNFLNLHSVGHGFTWQLKLWLALQSC